MNWLNIQTDTLRSEEYLGAEPVERATWLSLLGWCVTQENGGTIKDAAQWKDRKWQQVCGITKQEAELASELYYFDGEDLIVFAYPNDKEAEVQAKRKAGKKGGRPRKPLKNKGEKPYGLANENHEVQLSKREAETEGKGREGKGKGIGKEGEATRERVEPPGTNPMLELQTKINTIRPEWGKPEAWSYSEQQHLHNGCARQMAELDDQDWQELNRFFRAHLDNAKAYWRPNSRSKFVESFADVWASCQRWQGKQGRTRNQNQNNDTIWK